MDDYLKKIYFDPMHVAGFGGIEKLYQFVKKDDVFDLSRKQVKRWLEGNDTYTFIVPLDASLREVESWRMEWMMYGKWILVDLSSLSRHNAGYKYLLTCIDVLTKFAWAIPLKDKTGKKFGH